jgi:hypothetical protein
VFGWVHIELPPVVLLTIALPTPRRFGPRSPAPRARLRNAEVDVIHTPGSGCYGHNGADDVALDAALVARAAPGRPVKLQWMRDD